MANLTDPNTGMLLNAGYQSNQYIPIKRDRRWMSFFSSRVVADAACRNIPPYPTEGYAVIVSGGINNGCIGRYSSELGSWEYMQPWAGLTVQDVTGASWSYSGGAWAQQLSGGGSGSSSLPPWHGSLVPTPPDPYAQTALGSDAHVTVTKLAGRTLMRLDGAQASGYYAMLSAWDGGAGTSASLGILMADGKGSIECGLVVVGSSGRMIAMEIYRNSLHINRWSSRTTIDSVAWEQSSHVLTALPCPCWLRVSSDGATLTFALSANGMDFQPIYSEAIATFLGAVVSAGWGGNGTSAARYTLSAIDWRIP